MLTELGSRTSTSFNKYVNETYVYNVTTFLDEETGKHVFKRKLIGKLDKNTGATIPTRHKRPSKEVIATESAQDFEVLYVQAEKKRVLAETSVQNAEKAIDDVKNVVLSITNQLNALVSQLTNLKLS